MSPEICALAFAGCFGAAAWICGILAVLAANYAAHRGTRATRAEWDHWIGLEAPDGR